MLNTNELLAGLNNQEQHAIRKIYDDYFSALVVYANTIINNDGEAQDIVSITITKLWNKKLSFNTLNEVKAFLFIAVKNACLNYLKKNKREERKRKELQDTVATVQEASSDSKFEIQAIDKLIEAVLEILEPQCAAVLKLTIEGYTPVEIANSLNISAQQVYTQISNARKRLRPFLKENGKKFGLSVVFILLFILIKYVFSNS